jgi:hypothetical protein
MLFPPRVIEAWLSNYWKCRACGLNVGVAWPLQAIAPTVSSLIAASGTRQLITAGMSKISR